MAPTTPYASVATTLTELKALDATERSDMYIVAIEDTNDISPFYTPSSWYIFMANSTEPAMGKVVIVPDDNPTKGRWYKLDGPYVTTDSEDRITKPPFAGVECHDGTASRTTYYYSTGNNSPTDWIPFFGEIRVSGTVPSFTANFIGELAYNTADNALYIAEALTNTDWYNVVTGLVAGGGGGS